MLSHGAELLLLAAPLALVLVRDADPRRPLAEFALIARRPIDGAVCPLYS